MGRKRRLVVEQSKKGDGLKEQCAAASIELSDQARSIRESLAMRKIKNKNIWGLRSSFCFIKNSPFPIKQRPPTEVHKLVRRKAI